MKCAWVTLLATDNFVPGVLMVAESLRKVKSQYDLIVIATNNLTPATFKTLEDNHIQYRIFPYVSFFCDGERNMTYWAGKVDQTENVWWNCTLAKNYMFLFTEYDKIGFIDADMEFIQNCDHYFDYPIPAAFKRPWAEGMYGALMIIKPDIQDYLKCMDIGVQEGVVNDEMVWLRWYPNFAIDTSHHLPEDDMKHTDYLFGLCPTTQRLMHHDGFNKPWLN